MTRGGEAWVPAARVWLRGEAALRLDPTAVEARYHTCEFRRTLPRTCRAPARRPCLARTHPPAGPSSGPPYSHVYGRRQAAAGWSRGPIAEECGALRWRGREPGQPHRRCTRRVPPSLRGLRVVRLSHCRLQFRSNEPLGLRHSRNPLAPGAPMRRVRQSRTPTLTPQDVNVA